METYLFRLSIDNLVSYIYLLSVWLYQVKAAVAALRNTRGLNWPSSFEQERQKAGELDLLDWLRAMFGFQACISNLESLFRVTV